MDNARAKALENELVGKCVGGWLVDSAINFGKSAAVFKASKSGLSSALKVFDRELIERFGADIQLSRINRELTLKGHSHPNLVQIYDGGYDSESDSYFIAMEYVPVSNLEDLLHEIAWDEVPNIVEQLASAAKYLESRGLAHRDIKPSNIAWQREKKLLTLLDLGVLGPFGEVGQLTDVVGRTFIGTLQYSSPEYLLRDEDDSIDGWQALTFYQIGAVMHDLIMKKPIFHEFSTPYGRLVNAVQHEQPLIQSTSAPPSIVDLARRCLVKKPQIRLNLVSWSSFCDLQSGDKSSAKERVTNRTMMSVASSAGNVSTIDHARQRTKIEVEVSALLRNSIRAIRSDNSIFPPVTVIPKADEGAVFMRFDRSNRHGLPNGLGIFIRCNVLDVEEPVIELLGKLDRPDDTSSYDNSFFKGLIDRSAIHAALEEFVYTMLDSVQQV